MFGKLSLHRKADKGSTTETKKAFNEPKVEKTKIIAKKERKKKDSNQQSEKWLKGSKFRMLNELLYTSTSKEAKQYF